MTARSGSPGCADGNWHRRHEVPRGLKTLRLFPNTMKIWRALKSENALQVQLFRARFPVVPVVVVLLTPGPRGV